MAYLFDTDQLEKPVVVFGAGSIGERHIGILQKIGFKSIYVYRTRNLPLREINQDTINVFTDLSDIESISPVAAIICTPTSLHLEQAVFCASRGIHVLIEKPISHTAHGIEALSKASQENGTLVQVAYMLRYHPGMRKIKDLILSKKLGKVLSFHTHWGEYLPDWHPWEDYRQSYAGRRDLGGGAALTLSHDLDIVNWWFDDVPENYFSIQHTSSPLEVDVESGIDYILKYPEGISGHIHLNFYQKVPYRNYQLILEEGVITFDYFENQLTVNSKNQREVTEFMAFNRNDMFLHQTLDFFNMISGSTGDKRIQHSLEQIKSATSLVKMTYVDK